MDRLVSMTAFVKTVEIGSFAAAALALEISPQMIAKHIAYLERRMGTRLINRTTRRQSLTEIGKAYYERCKVVLADAEWADALAEQASTMPRGRLRVNAPVSFGICTLLPVVAAYMAQYPEVELDLDLNDHYVDPVLDEFEAVFRIGPLKDSSFTARQLKPFHLAAYASPAYLYTRGPIVTPDDLARHDCLTYASATGLASSLWRFSKDGKDFAVDVRSRARMNSARALMSAALLGMGVVLIAEDLARDSVDAGHLIRILADYEAPPRPVHLIYQQDRRQTIKLKSFIEAVVNALGVQIRSDPA